MKVTAINHYFNPQFYKKSMRCHLINPINSNFYFSRVIGWQVMITRMCHLKILYSGPMLAQFYNGNLLIAHLLILFIKKFEVFIAAVMIIAEPIIFIH